MKLYLRLWSASLLLVGLIPLERFLTSLTTAALLQHGHVRWDDGFAWLASLFFAFAPYLILWSFTQPTEKLP